MLAAIQLDDEGRFQTDEVTDISAEWMLSSELEATHLAAT